MQVRVAEQELAGDCACGTMLEHWQKYSAVPLPSFCYAMGCPGTPAVGATVQVGEAQNEPLYIVPLCIEHGTKRGDCIQLIPGAQLVLAKARRTCRLQGIRF